MPSYNIRTWTKAHELAKKARDKGYGFVVDGSTRVRVSHDKHGYRGHETVPADQAIYAVVHFSTEVLYFYPNGDIGVNLHGWDTITTKRRVDQHSPMRVGSYRGATHLFAGGISLPMETSQEYILTRSGTVVDPSGAAVSHTLHTCRPRKLPKGRNPVTKPLIGDLLRAPDGTCWIVGQSRLGDVNLFKFCGDLPGHRAWSVVTADTIQLTSLFILTMDGWTAVERFDIRMEGAK